MAPLSTTFSNANSLLTTLAKRSSDCDSYNTSCGTHRTILLVIIVIVGIFSTTVLFLVWVRGRRRAAARQRANARIIATQQQMKLDQAFSRYPSDMPPPPYMPQSTRECGQIGQMMATTENLQHLNRA